MTETSEGFSGIFSFLSNFSSMSKPYRFSFGSAFIPAVHLNTVEHVYQLSKLDLSKFNIVGIDNISFESIDARKKLDTIIASLTHPGKCKKVIKGFLTKYPDYAKPEMTKLDVRLQKMFELLLFKFSKDNYCLDIVPHYNESPSPNTFRSMLLKTDGIKLIEYNVWNDVTFGVHFVSKEGKNYLGKMLMLIRDWLKEPSCDYHLSKIIVSAKYLDTLYN